LDPLDVLCTALGDGAGAGAVFGGASVGGGAAALLGCAAGTAAGWADACAGGVAAAALAVVAFLVGLGVLRTGLGATVALAEDCELADCEPVDFAVVWLLVACEGAVRANRIANAAAATALSWVVRQVRRERRRRPPSRVAAGS
jgi:hypothetical protein